MWAKIGAAIWVFLQPYITPLLAAFAGEEWRRQLEEIKQLETERDAKQAAIDLLRSDNSPVAGSAKRLRDSRWNRKTPIL